jgi:transcriptional regulator with XRE-family HTH domain
MSTLVDTIRVRAMLRRVNLATLRTIARRKGRNQSEIARLTGVSRQAVSKWYRHARGDVQIRSTHLKALASGLGVPSDLLLDDLVGLRPDDREQLKAELLWDRAYPDLDAFLLALIAGERRALGRLVEAFGLFESARLLGRSVWSRFPDYNRHIHPTRRRGLEHVWQWRRNRTSA